MKNKCQYKVIYIYIYNKKTYDLNKSVIQLRQIKLHFYFINQNFILHYLLMVEHISAILPAGTDFLLFSPRLTVLFRLYLFEQYLR